jgi:hypothetical protein
LIHPDADGRRHGADEDEDHVPGADEHDDLAAARRNDRHDHEDHHDKRHDFRHLPSAVDIADDGNSNDAGGGRTKPLNEAQRQKPGKGRDHSDAEGGNDVNAEADQQRNTAAEAIGKRPVEKLGKSETEKIGGNDILAMIFVLDAEAGADLLQCGQHDVDGQRVDCHQESRKRDKFQLAHGQPTRGHGL